ncbi:exonuclease V [Fomitopsis serialis]|uniref:exonuclease V n=1 Tax=Fomitopsis serialis TaxID=139415 RepID=UPI00200748AF|nr:exonuclease V [Neoantrodia serialis]KAH9923629.1 exonuclease V [Neoantrodia serialis]
MRYSAPAPMHLFVFVRNIDLGTCLPANATYACIFLTIATVKPAAMSRSNLNSAGHDTKGVPLVDIEGGPPRGPSPYASFRRYRTWISVTDLVQPTWCELLYDYSLRSKAYLPPSQRPHGFRSADDKWIRIDKTNAEQSYRVTMRGRSEHKKLERQASLRKADVQAPEAKGKLEQWALRLVQMLEALHTLKESGLCREMPVFGIIHDNLVFGQIDNLVLKPSLTVTAAAEVPIQVPPGPPSQRKRKAAAAMLAEKAKKARVPSSEADYSAPSVPAGVDAIAETAAPVPTDAQGRPTSMRYTIHLSDTKTRTTPDLPPDEDSRAHHLQVMLYHRLLSGALAKHSNSTAGEPATSTAQPLDFDAVWRKLSLNPQQPFSDAFIRDARRLLDRGTRSPTKGAPAHGAVPADNSSPGRSRIAFECLNDLVALWRHAVEDFNVDGVDKTLTLEYRLQPSEQTDAGVSCGSHSQDTPPSTQGETVEGGSQVSEDTLVGTSQDTEATVATDEGQSTQVLSSSNTVNDVRSGTGLLGVKQFTMDDQLLGDHLRSILRWWHGQRRAKGVPPELTRRCEHCDYHEDCEWRARDKL